MYFVNAPPIPAAANAWRTVHGRDKAALAPTPYFRKVRLVIIEQSWRGILGEAMQNLPNTHRILERGIAPRSSVLVTKLFAPRVYQKTDGRGSRSAIPRTHA